MIEYCEGEDAEIRPLENLQIFGFRGNGATPESPYSWPEQGHKVQVSTSNPKYYKLGYLRIKSGLMFDSPIWNWPIGLYCKLRGDASEAFFEKHPEKLGLRHSVQCLSLNDM